MVIILPPMNLIYRPIKQYLNLFVCLCVDGFGIKYFFPRDADHLIMSLQSAYAITINKKGTNFCGLKLDWNHTKEYVDISMPKYAHKALENPNHIPPSTPQNAPHKRVLITYG